METVPGPERRKEGGVLYGDGHYYRKDRREKVSYHNTSNKYGKAQVKPSFGNENELERSALVKPQIIATNSDELALVKPNPVVTNQDGKRTGKGNKESQTTGAAGDHGEGEEGEDGEGGDGEHGQAAAAGPDRNGEEGAGGEGACS
jgi:hypothetical protein